MPETDPVQSLLQKSPLSQAQRADLWDAYHSASDADDLASKIEALGVPKAVKANLWDLKATSKPAAISGPLEPGNIDLRAQPKVKNADGTISTVDSRSYNFDGKEYLLPSVTPDGRHLKTDDAIVAEFKKTGRHLGVFADADSATAFAKQLHDDYAAGKYEPARTWTDTAEDLAIGAAKGVGNTVYGLGKLVHDYTPIGRISDAIQPGAFDPANKPPELTPTNTPQKIGQAAEQVGEFFLPTGIAGKAAKAAEVAKSGMLTLAQGGSPTAAGVSAGLTAVIPGANATQKAATALKESALETMAGSLKATKEWAKIESERLAPEMLKRGVGGSIKAVRAHASEMAAKVGKNLHDAYETAAAAGETVPGLIIRGNIQLASDSLHTLAATGKRLAVPGNEAAIAQLDDLEHFVDQLKPDIPVNQAAAIKQQFDDIVERAGLFGPKALASASEKAQGWSFKQASDSFRELLNTNPTIEKLNEEASFWIGLRNVANATKVRRVGQVGGLIPTIAATSGAAVGAGAAGPVGAAAGALIGNRLARVMQSPYYMSKVSAPLKNALADALASNSAGQIASVTQRIIASLPAQARAQLSGQ